MKHDEHVSIKHDERISIKAYISYVISQMLMPTSINTLKSHMAVKEGRILFLIVHICNPKCVHS